MRHKGAAQGLNWPYRLVLVAAFLLAACAPQSEGAVEDATALEQAMIAGTVVVFPMPGDEIPNLSERDALRWEAAQLFRERFDFLSIEYPSPVELAEVDQARAMDASGLDWEKDAERIIARAQALDDPLPEFYARVTLGERAMPIGEEEKAAAQFAAAAEAAQASGITSVSGPLLMARGFAAEAEGQYGDAFDSFLEAMRYYDRTRLRRQAMRLCVYLDRSARMLNGEREPQDYRDLAIQEADAGRYWPAICMYSVSAISELIRGDNNAAGPDLEAAYQLSVGPGQGYALGNLLNFQSVQAHQTGDLALAISKITEGIELAEATNRTMVQANLYTNLAIYIREAGDFERAIEVQQKELDLLLEHHPDRADAIMLSYLNQGENHAKAGRHEEAISWYDKAAGIQGDVEDPYNLGTLDSVLAQSLYELGKIEEAIAAAERSSALMKETRKPGAHIVESSWIGARHAELGNLARARDYLTEIDTLVAENGEPAMESGSTDAAYEARYLRSMSEMTAALGENERALAYGLKYLENSESQSSQQQLESLANADARMQLRDRERELDYAERERLLLASEVEQARMQNVLELMVVIAVAVIAFALYRAYRSQQRLAQNRDMWLSEIHHRTKNNLAVLSSLFRMEERRAKQIGGDDTSHRDAANRARVMALVQEHLYGNGSGSDPKLKLNEFLGKLLDLLAQSCGSDGIAVNRELEEVSVEAEFATPVGLIVCELVTNAYKHAFDTGSGSISVRLAKTDEGAEIWVDDDGVGFELAASQARNNGSLGMDLVHGLASQIGAGISHKKSEPGTSWKVSPIPVA